ncbi:MAG: RNA-binding S4 domain-containing protein [Pseudomonadota bacterium]
MGGPEKIRVDKWLWFARFFKTRTRAGEVVLAGIRINGERCAKPAQSVRPGEVLTFAQGRQVRVIRIEACGTRRGPSEEAQTLYTDLAPPDPSPPSDKGSAPAKEGRDPGSGRPTKRERREIDALRRSDP